MRVISGSARGRKLKQLSDIDIRPTSDMIKESVFNIIQFDIEGRRVLDLFAGTGQLGIEALSRGARGAVFVDTNPAAVKLIKENIELCGFSGISTVYRRDVLNYLEHSEAFDLIFIDPPYDSLLAAVTLGKIIEFDKLNTNGIIICETRANHVMPPVLIPCFTQKEYKYGGAKVTRIVRSEQS